MPGPRGFSLAGVFVYDTTQMILRRRVTWTPVQSSDPTSIDLKWIAVGTGKALKMGENCDVDILLVHAPASEKKFIDDRCKS